MTGTQSQFHTWTSKLSIRTSRKNFPREVSFRITPDGISWNWFNPYKARALEMQSMNFIVSGPTAIPNGKPKVRGNQWRPYNLPCSMRIELEWSIFKRSFVYGGRSVNRDIQYLSIRFSSQFNRLGVFPKHLFKSCEEYVQCIYSNHAKRISKASIQVNARSISYDLCLWGE